LSRRLHLWVGPIFGQCRTFWGHVGGSREGSQFDVSCDEAFSQVGRECLDDGEGGDIDARGKVQEFHSFLESSPAIDLVGQVPPEGAVDGEDEGSEDTCLDADVEAGAVLFQGPVMVVDEENPENGLVFRSHEIVAGFLGHVFDGVQGRVPFA